MDQAESVDSSHTRSKMNGIRYYVILLSLIVLSGCGPSYKERHLYHYTNGKELTVRKGKDGLEYAWIYTPPEFN